MLKVAHALNILIRRPLLGSYRHDNLFAKLCIHLRMLTELVEQEAERAGSRVSAGQKDINNLITDDLTVAGACGGKGMKKRLVFIFFEGRRIETKALVDDGLDKGIEDLETRVQGCTGYEARQGTNTTDYILRGG